MAQKNTVMYLNHILFLYLIICWWTFRLVWYLGYFDSIIRMHWQQLSRSDPVCVLRTLCTIFCGDCTSLYSHLQCAILFPSCIHSSMSVLSLCHWYMSSGPLTLQGLLSTLSYISSLFFPFLDRACHPAKPSTCSPPASGSSVGPTFVYFLDDRSSACGETESKCIFNLYLFNWWLRMLNIFPIYLLATYISSFENWLKLLLLILLIDLFLFMCISVSIHTCVYTTGMLGIHEGQDRVLHTLYRELPCECWKLNLGWYKSSKNSSLLSHLSSAPHFNV